MASEQKTPTRRPLCRLDDITDGGAIGVEVAIDDGWDLVLLRRGDAVYAYHNICGHQNRRMDYVPGKFLVKNACLICAVHGSSFAVESGEHRGGPASSGLKAVPVRVADGQVWLDLPNPG